MAIDFPNSPTTGDTHTVNGRTWTYDGTGWIIYGPSIDATVLRIDSDNNRVGINNASPTTALDVTGDLTVSGKVNATAPTSTKTASYTLAAGDENTRIVMNNAGATTITVDDGVFAAGDTVWIHNIGAGTCTVTAGTATVNTAASLDLAQWEGGSLFFTSASSAIFFRGAGGLDVFAVEYLVVAGGGGAGAGAGGAGGMLTGTAYLSLGGVTLTVGTGGAGSGSQSVSGTSGGESRLGAIFAVGGGGGGNGESGYPLKGGSGGARYRAISAGQIGLGIDGQGNDGGVGNHTGLNSGGGGGAGAVGQDSPSATVAGNGGVGLTTTIITTAQATSWSVGEVSGSDLYFAGGGGGYENDSGQTGGTGGLGGGGNGAANANGTNGTANTGGGGGGKLANGGSGVVILKWLTADASISVGAGLTSVNTTVGDYSVYAFTAGTDTVTFS
jgi:hypothetical protein